MNIFPLWSIAPSESTIEQLSNHVLLTLLAPQPAWMFVPTKNEEKDLGFDASLQGMKGCVVQYKRIRPLKRTGGVSARIDPAQLGVLHAAFPPLAHPYAFIAVGEFHSYKELASHVSRTGALAAGRHCCFIDIHRIPVSTTSLQVVRTHPTAPAVAQPFTTRTPGGPPTICLTVNDLADRIASCSAGIPATELANTRPSRDGIVVVGRLSILFARPRVPGPTHA